MVALDWEKIDLSALVDGEELWDLVSAAHDQVQEMAHGVWTQAEKLNRSSVFASMKEMIPAPEPNMPLWCKVKFFRNQAQRLRRTAAVISSDAQSLFLGFKLPLLRFKLAPIFHSEITFKITPWQPLPQQNYRSDSSTATY